MRHAALTDAERNRARAASLDALQRGLAAGARLMLDGAFPEPLAAADSMPPVLVTQGDPACLDAPTVAIVGTRAASTYAQGLRLQVAQAFAAAGVTVVSGGALGIDAAAHKGAMEEGGRTVAVLAAGVDNVYPALHAGLFRQIAASGCLVSSFALGTKPSDYKFLLRNDLVAALSLAVLVVEAPARSGALRTAQSAVEMGRDVFVVPAGIREHTFYGSLNLIRDGATLVYHPDQILEALGIDPAPPAELLPPASSAGERILAALADGPLAPSSSSSARAWTRRRSYRS